MDSWHSCLVASNVTQSTLAWGSMTIAGQTHALDVFAREPSTPALLIRQSIEENCFSSVAAASCTGQVTVKLPTLRVAQPVLCAMLSAYISRQLCLVNGGYHWSRNPPHAKKLTLIVSGFSTSSLMTCRLAALSALRLLAFDGSRTAATTTSPRARSCFTSSKPIPAGTDQPIHILSKKLT